MVADALPEGMHAPPEAIERALRAARDGGMHEGAVWRRVWAVGGKGDADVAALTEHLSHDGSFLAEQALALTAATTSAARALLHAALRACPEPDARRLHLLHAADLAETYVSMHGSGADVAGLRELVATGPREAAAGFAAAGNSAALSLLFRRHPHALAPSALQILAALPPALPPSEYLPLLQRLAAEQPAAEPTRAPDAAEAPGNPALLAAADDPRLPDGALAALHSAPAAPTEEEVDAWVVERAAAIDDEGGSVFVARALLKSWAAAGHAAAAPAAAALNMWLAVLKHALAAGVRTELRLLSTRELLCMSGPAQMRLALVDTLPETLPTPQAADVITEVRPRPHAL